MEKLRSASGPFRGHSLGPTPPEDDELTHVGPRAPYGEYMRRFWLPVAMSSQLVDRVLVLETAESIEEVLSECT